MSPRARGAAASRYPSARRLSSRRALELLDVARDADRRSGEAAEGLQHLQVDAREALRRQVIECQQAPWLFVDADGATHAVVHGQMPLHAFDQSVIGVGQAAVGRKSQGSIRFEQGGEARMLFDAEPTAQRIAAQAVHGQRQQPTVLEAQQRGRVAREQHPQRLQQAAIAFGAGQFARDVGHQRDDGLEQGVRCHIDSIRVAMTAS